MELYELKKYITARLEALTTLYIYDLIAPNSDRANFPYLVYNFTSASNTIRLRDDWILEIDYYNNSNDDSAILEAAKDIKAAFNYSYQSETEGFYQAHIEFQGQIPTNEQDLIRYQQRYLLKVR